MKIFFNLLFLFIGLSFTACSSEDCSNEIDEINAQYENWFDNENLTDSEKAQMQKEWDAKLENACD